MKLSTVAVALGDTPAGVRRLIAAGQLPGSLRVGRRVLHVPARSVFDLIAASAHNTSEA